MNDTRSLAFGLLAMFAAVSCTTFEDIGHQLWLTDNAEGYQELSEASD